MKLTSRGLMSALFLVVLGLGLAGPAVVWAQTRDPFLSDSQEPGSVLVFPKFIRGTVVTHDQGVLPTSAFEISVNCPKGSENTATCNAGTTVRLRAHWVCPGNAANICREADFNLSTTVFGTIRINPENVDGVTQTVSIPPCDRGFLIVWVVNASGVPIKFDGLIGDAILRPDPVSAGAYNAIPIQAADTILTGNSTDVAPADGNLDFNGLEYKTLTARIFGTVRYNDPVVGITTSLTLLTLDVLSNRVNRRTFVDFQFFNEAETLRSTSTNFVCWQEVSLTTIDPSLTSAFGTKGLVRSGPAVQQAPTTTVTLLGIIDTTETSDPGFLRAYSYSLYNDSVGVNTTFDPDPVDPTPMTPITRSMSGAPTPSVLGSPASSLPSSPLP